MVVVVVVFWAFWVELDCRPHGSGRASALRTLFARILVLVLHYCHP